LFQVESSSCTREERLPGHVFEKCETERTLMAQKKFRLSARISSDNPSSIRPILGKLISGKGAIKSIENGFEVEADLEGESARALNRMLLSEMRKAEKRTRIRAEWTSGNTIEKFFDYVPKGTHKLNQEHSR
jgi:hypothetical protein